MSESSGGATLPIPILILIPAYNEAARISTTVREARPFAPVLVIDDGSVDETVAAAEAAGALVLRQPFNQGKGSALQAGFRWALDRGVAAVITLDADGQHDPAEIPTFLNSHHARPSDLIIGERDFTSMPLVRRLSNSAGRAIFSWSIGRNIPDNQSGYRLISRRLMEAMVRSSEQGFEFEVEMIVTAVERDFRILGVPIRTIYSGEGSHIRPLPHVFHFFRISVATWRRMHRLPRRG